MKKFLLLFLLLLAAACAPAITAPETGFHSADALVRAKSYSDAAAEYNKIIKNHPEAPQAAKAKFGIAIIYTTHNNPQKDYVRALQEFDEFLKAWPNHELAHEAGNWQTVLKALLDTSMNALLNPTRELLRKRLEWLMPLGGVTEELIDLRLALWSIPETRSARAGPCQ